MKTVVVIPTYNEKDNIAKLVAEIFTLYPTIYVLVVDDNSPDGTAQVVQNLIPSNPQLSLKIRPAKTGLGDAYRETLSELAGDENISNIITMDADGSHQPVDIAKLIIGLEKNDLVIGSRYVAGGRIIGWSLWRQILSRGGNWYARNIAGLPIHDLTTGFTGFQRQLLNKIDWSKFDTNGYAYLIEFKFYSVRRGAHWQEVPITFIERRAGQSKLSSGIIREAITCPWHLRFTKNQ